MNDTSKTVGIAVLTGVISGVTSALAIDLIQQYWTKKEAFVYAQKLANSKGIINLGAGPHRTLLAQEISLSTAVGANIDIAPDGMPHFIQLDIETERLPFDDRQFGCAFCVLAGTRVSGGNMPIETLRPGDKILGRAGKTIDVIASMSRLYTGTMVSIKPAGLLSVHLTAEHPVAVASLKRHHVLSKPHHIYQYDTKWCWKRAIDVCAGEWLIVPRRHDSNVQEISIGWRKPLGYIRRTRAPLPLDSLLAWLLGVFVAEGFISQSGHRCRISFTIGSHKKALRDKLLSNLRRLGLTPYVLNRDNEHAIVISVTSKAWHDWLAGAIGRGAHIKRVPEVVKASPQGVIEAFLKGWIAGDGNLSGGMQDITTVSQQLAYDAVELLGKLGIPAAIYSYYNKDRTIKGRDVKASLVYRVRFSSRAWQYQTNHLGKQPYSTTCRVAPYVIYRKVKSVRRWDVKGLEVFNLRTTDETFSIPFLTHNCSHILEHLDNWDFALGEAMRVADNVVIVLPHPLSPLGWLVPSHKQHFSFSDIREIERLPNVKIFY